MTTIKKMSLSILRYLVPIALLLTAWVIFFNPSKPDSYEQVYITVDELTQKIEKQEDFIAIIVSKNCNYCQSLKKDLSHSNTDKIHTLYFIEVVGMNNTNKEKLLTVYPELKQTPSVYFHKKGVLVNEMIGYQKYELFEALKQFYE